MSDSCLARRLLTEIAHRRWLTFSSYEPVGVSILLMKENGEILLGQRTSPSNKGYNNPNSYYRIVDGKLTKETIDNPVLWSYP